MCICVLYMSLYIFFFLFYIILHIYIYCCVQGDLCNFLNFSITNMAKKHDKTQERATKIRTKSVYANSDRSNKNTVLLANNYLIIIAIICIVIAAWFGYKGYLETRVKTPYNVEKACNTYCVIILHIYIYIFLDFLDILTHGRYMCVCVHACAHIYKYYK